MTATIELSLLTDSQGFVIQGDASLDQTGWGVSAGDLNGDGYDDVIVGTRRGAEEGDDRLGAVYVVFGKPGTDRADIDLSFLDDEGFSIRGAAIKDWAGRYVSSAGDVNGDGFDDVIIGAPFTGEGYGFDGPPGAVYMVFGRAGADRSDIDLGDLAGDGFVISGGEIQSTAGFSVASAGDVNGDGLDDVIIGSPKVTDVITTWGEAFVVFGKPGADRPDIDLSSLGGDGFAITSFVGDRSGYFVSSAGDFNDDDLGDVFISASGGAYLVFGKPGSTRANVDELNLGDGGIVIRAPSISFAGDVNGDGISDLIVSNGEGVFVLYGNAEPTPSDIDLTALGGHGFAISPGANAGAFNLNRLTAGDVNGDGLDDVIIGATSLYGTGGVYVVFGKTGETRVDVDLSDLASDGVFIQGASEGDWAGASVSGAGDINNDGFDDLIIAAPNADSGGTNAGDVYVVFGRADFEAFGTQHRFLANSGGFAGEIGGAGTVFGTSGFQDISISSMPGTIRLDASFNKGGDILRLPGNASDWQVTHQGTLAVFMRGDTLVKVPVGPVGMPVVFDDGVRKLIVGEQIEIGGQAVIQLWMPITAAPDGTSLPDGADPFSSATLLLYPGAEVTAGGRLKVHGTADADNVTITSGEVLFDASFNKGGDTIAVDEAASDFTARVVGSQVLLEGSDTDLTIPVGPAGLTLSFADGEAMLVYDAVLGAVLIGGQTIGAGATPLSFA